jgi:hypothetical protein
MMYSQYLRIETKAGGVYCSDREFIKACHSILSKKGKSAARRATRHNWIRQGLKHKADALNVAKLYRL